jgi:hypothetical protein
MAALLLIAALLLPAGTPQTIVALAAGAGVLLSLGGLRR